MRPQRSTLIALVGAAVLVAPPTAAGQGAVDEQYRDPFAGGGRGGSDTEQSNTEEDTTPPAPPGGGVATPTDIAPVATTGAELPRTGFPSGIVAALGAGLLAAGTTLRRRLHPTP